MPPSKNSITQIRLKELFKYEPDTGIFIRLCRVARQAAGAVAGTKTNRGSVAIWIDGVRYSAHRLAWLYMNGSFPDSRIDHINRDSLDNRWANLRLATHQQNMANRTGNSPASKVKGVYWDGRKGRWYTQLRFEGRIYYAGSYPDLDSAKAAIQSKRLEIHKEFACHG